MLLSQEFEKFLDLEWGRFRHELLSRYNEDVSRVGLWSISAGKQALFDEQTITAMTPKLSGHAAIYDYKAEKQAYFDPYSLTLPLPSCSPKSGKRSLSPKSGKRSLSPKTPHALPCIRTPRCFAKATAVKGVAVHTPPRGIAYSSMEKRPLFESGRLPKPHPPWELDELPRKARLERQVSSSTMSRWESFIRHVSERSGVSGSSLGKMSRHQRQTHRIQTWRGQGTGTLQFQPVQLHEAWEEGQRETWETIVRLASLEKRRNRQIKLSSASSLWKGSPAEDMYIGSTIIGNSTMQRCMIHPDSKINMINAVVGALIISCDVMLFPVIFCFQVKAAAFEILSWVSTIYWSLDLPINFFTGYYSKGIVEMRPKRAACHYLTTWFFIDLVIVSSDWLSRALQQLEDAEGHAGGILRVSKSFKYYRILRVLRVLRLVKMLQILKSYLDGFATELLLVLVKLFMLILLLMVVSHYVACTWYFLAASHPSGEQTWMLRAGLEDEDQRYLYTVSFHWALTQFTPATNDIAAANSGERTFAIFIVLFAMIIFSSFLSSLTHALSQMQQIYLEQRAGESRIRQFLKMRRVPVDFARQIWHFYRHHYKAPPKRIHLVDLPVLRKLPTGLRLMLHNHISMPTLVLVKAFDLVSVMDYETILVTCDICLIESSFGSEQEIFNDGDSADFMFFVVLGRALYQCELYEDDSDVKLHGNQHLSELAVWTDWIHSGTLTAKSGMCEMVLLDVIKFRNTIVKRADHNALRCLRRYAAEYVKIANSSYPSKFARSTSSLRSYAITDIVHPKDLDGQGKLEKMTNKVFRHQIQQPEAPPGKVSKVFSSGSGVSAGSHSTATTYSPSRAKSLRFSTKSRPRLSREVIEDITDG